MSIVRLSPPSERGPSVFRSPFISLPVLNLSGSPFEQGRRHGDALKDRVAHNVEVYFDRFERETKLSRPQVLERAALYRDAIAEQNPDYFEGMRGVAEGSGFSLDVHHPH